MHNFNGLYEIELSGILEFQVSPKPTGLVGHCYKEKEIWYDFNLRTNHSDPKYGLNHHQVQITDYCEFAIAAPMFNANNKIDSIITFDSKVPVNEPADDQWLEYIKKACLTISLCKPLITKTNADYEPE